MLDLDSCAHFGAIQIQYHGLKKQDSIHITTLDSGFFIIHLFISGSSRDTPSDENQAQVPRSMLTRGIYLTVLSLIKGELMISLDH